jgi:hypothetical protein
MTSLESKQDTEFTLPEHYRERIAFHMKMLKYYLNEEKKYDRLGT